MVGELISTAKPGMLLPLMFLYTMAQQETDLHDDYPDPQGYEEVAANHC